MLDDLGGFERGQDSRDVNHGFQHPLVGKARVEIGAIPVPWRDLGQLAARRSRGIQNLRLSLVPRTKAVFAAGAIESRI